MGGAQGGRRLRRLPDFAAAEALIDLLAAVGEDEAEQAALNEVLEGLGSSARVVQSQGRDNSAD